MGGISEKSNLNIQKNSKFSNFGGGYFGVNFGHLKSLHSKDLIQIIYIIHIFTQMKYFLQLSLNLKYNKYKI